MVLVLMLVLRTQGRREGGGGARQRPPESPSLEAGASG